MKTRFFLILLLILIFPYQIVIAQGDIKTLAQKNGKMYMKPLITSFGMNMNSGLTHTAKVHKILGFDISLKLMFDAISDEDKVFEFDVSNLEWEFMGITIPGDVLFTETEVPTIFGGTGTLAPDKDNVADYLNQQLGTSLTGSDLPSEIDDLAIPLTGVDISIVPLARPQISIGLPLNSELLFSYIPIPLGDLGDGSFRSFGLKHSLDQYIPLPMPFLNLSVQAVFQNLDLNVITSSHSNFNLQVSADFPIVTFYALLGVDKSNLEASYTISDPGSPLDGEKIEFDIEGENGFRTTFGLRLKLLLLYLNADYTLGTHNTFSLGVGVTFR